MKSPCLEPRCRGFATHRGGRCATHAQERDAAITRAGGTLYSTKRWQMTRRRQLHTEPLCRVCGAIATDVDHVVPLEAGGDPWASDNLQSLCKSHHSQKTWREVQGVPPRMLDLIVLVGASGVGKTAIGRHLSLLLGMPFVGPDDFEDGWKGLWHHIYNSDTAIIECCRVPPSVLKRQDRTERFRVIELTASQEVRRERLRLRGESEDRIEAWSKDAEDQRLSFHADLKANRRLDTSAVNPTEAAGTIAAWVRR